VVALTRAQREAMGFDREAFLNQPPPGGPEEGYVIPTSMYLLHCQGFYKVGIAANVRSRLSTIQTSNPHKVTLERVNNYPCRAYAVMAERLAHQLLAPHRRSGEWFGGLDRRQIGAVLSEAQSAMKMLIDRHRWAEIKALRERGEWVL